jgi:hypothetical protein
METKYVRLLFMIILFGMATASAVCAQGPRGVGADIKPNKIDKAKSAKPEKPTPLYTFPKSASWWDGGGPGPAGAGMK